MASVLAGFRPVKHINGSPFNGQVNRYVVPAAEALVLNVGDLVKLSDSASDAPYPACERSTFTTTGPILGAVVGFEVDTSNLNAPNIRQTLTRRIALVADDPTIIFAAPQDGVGGVISVNSIGLNVAVAPGADGVATSPGASIMAVDSSTVGTGSTLPFKVVGITDSPDNDPTSTSRPAEVLVLCNSHQHGTFISGV